MIYQHPLAYLMGLEGMALLRAFCDGRAPAFTGARLASMRRLLDAAAKLGDGGSAEPDTMVDGYDSWAEYYDEPGNMLIDIEQPLVHRILDDVPPGTALDAACGTGRHAAYLARLGHDVIGVDTSPGMLAKARAKVPNGRFHEADLHRLPVGDEQVDTVVCALALNHVDDLEPVFAEFARVLRPGGHLVVSDHRNLLGNFGWPLLVRGEAGVGYVRNRTHPTSAYLAAALPLGFRVHHCEEPLRPYPFVDDTGTPPNDTGPVPAHDPDDLPNIWALHPWSPEAANAAYRDTPAAIIWHFLKHE